MKKNDVVVLSTRVPLKVKQILKAEAKKNGITLGRYVCSVLKVFVVKNGLHGRRR